MGTTLGCLRHIRAQEQEVKWKGGSLPQGKTLRPTTQSGASRKPRLRGTLGKPQHGPVGNSKIMGREGSSSGARYRSGPQGSRGSQGGPLWRDRQPQRAGPYTAVTRLTCPGCPLGALRGLGTAGARGRE